LTLSEAEVDQKLKEWKLQSLLKVVVLMPVFAEGMEAWSNG